MKSKNPWLEHVKKTKSLKVNKGKSLSEILKSAKKTYTPKKSK
jgi:hypothetical protein